MSKKRQKLGNAYLHHTRVNQNSDEKELMYGGGAG